MRVYLLACFLAGLSLTGCVASAPVKDIQINVPSVAAPSAAVRDDAPTVTVSPEEYFRRLGGNGAATVIGQSVTRRRIGSTTYAVLSKLMEVRSFGDSAAVYCARESTVLAAFGYMSATVDAQPGSAECQCRFMAGQRTGGIISVRASDSPDSLLVRLVIVRALPNPK